MGTKSDNPRQSQDEVSGILENGWTCSGEKDAYKTSEMSSNVMSM